MNAVAEALLDPIADDLAEFERRLEASIADDLGPMASAMELIVRAGGKRFRPALVLLSARLGRADRDHTFNIAMGIEFIHTATLVHDDLIDNSPTRRGIRTLHEEMGPAPAIIIGDYYFAKGANLISSVNEPSIDSAISNAVMTICMGELLQMTSRNDFDQSVEAYHRKIERKTATLVSTCCFAGGVVGGLGSREVEALARYGHQLGMAFQVADDVLDYIATSAEMGKPVGADLRQGTVTLPLMLALRDPAVGTALRDLLATADLNDDEFDRVVSLVRQSDAVAGAEMHAQQFAEQARSELAVFPPSEARTALEQICDYVVERRI